MFMIEVCGRTVIVDTEDSWLLNYYLLSIVSSPGCHTKYVTLKERVTKNYIGMLHRLIMNAPNDRQVDHENGNGLDCRKDNMRLATPSQNAQNRRVSALSTSGYKGVNWVKSQNSWRAGIKLDGKFIFLGYSPDIETAIARRKAAEAKYFPEFNGLGTT